MEVHIIYEEVKMEHVMMKIDSGEVIRGGELIHTYK